jgi:hypothetical protein
MDKSLNKQKLKKTTHRIWKFYEIQKLAKLNIHTIKKSKEVIHFRLEAVADSGGDRCVTGLTW